MCLCGLCNDDPEVTQDTTLNSQTDPRKLQDSVCKSATLIINHRSVITSNSWFTITHTHTDQCERVMRVQQHNGMPLVSWRLVMCSNQQSLITSFPSAAPLKFQPCTFISAVCLFSNNPDRRLNAAASSGSLRWKSHFLFLQRQSADAVVAKRHADGFYPEHLCSCHVGCYLNSWDADKWPLFNNHLKKL